MTAPRHVDNRWPVQAIRHLLAQRHIATLICAAALVLKILVPTGYMVAPDHGRFSVMICSGMTPQAEAMAMPGMDHAMAAMHGDAPDPGKSNDHGKPEMPCSFAGLSAQVLGAVDVVLLAVALAAVALMALRIVPHGVLRPADHLRPPLRGPPLIS